MCDGVRELITIDLFSEFSRANSDTEVTACSLHFVRGAHAETSVSVVHKDKQLVDRALQLGVTAVGYIGTELLLRTSNCSNGSAGFAVLLVCSISAALFLV